eukprot:m.325732 g.325732  ORF g.325732 m.325732 type:complete len:343 (+) comp20388_c0_seq1:1450-2478(+)
MHLARLENACFGTGSLPSVVGCAARTGAHNMSSKFSTLSSAVLDVARVLRHSRSAASAVPCRMGEIDKRSSAGRTGSSVWSLAASAGWMRTIWVTSVTDSCVDVRSLQSTSGGTAARIAVNASSATGVTSVFCSRRRFADCADGIGALPRFCSIPTNWLCTPSSYVSTRTCRAPRAAMRWARLFCLRNDAKCTYTSWAMLVRSMASGDVASCAMACVAVFLVLASNATGGFVHSEQLTDWSRVGCKTVLQTPLTLAMCCSPTTLFCARLVKLEWLSRHTGSERMQRDRATHGVKCEREYGTSHACSRSEAWRERSGGMLELPSQSHLQRCTEYTPVFESHVP